MKIRIFLPERASPNKRNITQPRLAESSKDFRGCRRFCGAADKSIFVSASLDRKGQLTYHSLYSIDLSTGNVTFIGNMEVGTNIAVAAMDFDRSRQLFGLDDNGNEWIIDPGTAAVTLLGNTGGNY